jgi:hypothetical protein
MVNLPQQTNYAVAIKRAAETLRAVPAEDCVKLGATLLDDGCYSLPVLNVRFLVDPAAGKVTLAEGDEVRVGWAILALHYLISPVLTMRGEPQISFAQIPDGMGYASPYRGRVIERFLHTAGRTDESFRAAAEGVGGVPVRLGDAAYRFDVFPTFPITIIRYAGDDELPPGASMLYVADAAGRFSVEDIVVMSESLISKLSGKDW